MNWVFFIDFDCNIRIIKLYSKESISKIRESGGIKYRYETSEVERIDAKRQYHPV